MASSNFPHILVFEEHGHLVFSVQSPLSDDQWRALCRRIAARARADLGIVLDLKGVDVLDSFSASALQELYKTLRFQGEDMVIAGIPLPVTLTMIIRGLNFGDTPVVRDMSEAYNFLEHPPTPMRRH